MRVDGAIVATTIVAAFVAIAGNLFDDFAFVSIFFVLFSTKVVIEFASTRCPADIFEQLRVGGYFDKR